MVHPFMPPQISIWLKGFFTLIALTWPFPSMSVSTYDSHFVENAFVQ